MKIMLLTTLAFPPSRGGSQMHVYQIGRHLAQRGHKVIIVTLRASSKLDLFSFQLSPPFFKRKTKMEKMGRCEKIEGVQYLRFPVCLHWHNWYISPQLYLKLPSLIRKVDLVHAHKFYSPEVDFVAFICNLLGKPFVFTAHDLRVGFGVLTRETWTLAKLYEKTLGKISLKLSNALIALTRDNALDYLKMGAPKEKIKVVPNGVDVSDYVAGRSVKEEIIKQKYSLSPDDKIVLFVGRYVPYKGLETLIRAMYYVVSEMANVRCLIVGKEDDKDYLRQLLKLRSRLKLSRSIIITGEISQRELLAAYRMSDVFVLPSHYEGFGLTILEAMVNRLPCIATRGSACEHIIDDGRTGFLVDAMNPSKLAEKICTLLQDEKLRGIMGERAFEKVVCKYTWNRVVDRLEEIYDRLSPAVLQNNRHMS